jgi:ABC-2 type transport system permease protein
MKQIWVISKRELQSFFDSLTAYIMLVAFLGFSGLFTWLYGSDIFMVKQASLQTFFVVAPWTLFIFIPALTMRLFAEENKTGTIELLLTRPVNDWQVVIGKFLATLLLVVIALAFTLPYYFTVASLGKIDHGAVITGYLGLILMSAAYVSIGIFTSSISNNQIVGFLLALAILIMFQLLFSFIGQGTGGIVGEVLDYLSVETHYESISRGVLDSKDIIFFLSLIFLGLVSTEAVLTKNRR